MLWCVCFAPKRVPAQKPTVHIESRAILAIMRLRDPTFHRRRRSLPLERLDEAREKCPKRDQIFWREGAEHPPLDRLDPFARGVKRLAPDFGHVQLEYIGMPWTR